MSTAASSVRGPGLGVCDQGGPCYRCLIPSRRRPGLVPSCAEGGVLGVLPGVIGDDPGHRDDQADSGHGEPLAGRLLLYDAWKMRFRELKLRRDPECPVCGDNPTVKELVDYDQFCGIAPQSASTTAATGGLPAGWETTVEDLKRRIDAKEDVFILDVREPNEYRDLPHPGRHPDSAGRAPEAGRRGHRRRRLARHHRPLQDGRSKREGRAAAARTRRDLCSEPGRWDPRLDRLD